MGTHNNNENDAAENIKVMATEIILQAHDAGYGLVSYLARIILEELNTSVEQRSAHTETSHGRRSHALDSLR